MRKTFTGLLFAFLLLTVPGKLLAQQKDRIQQIQVKLDSMSAAVTGLKQTVQLTFNGVTIQDYLLALGRTNNISISIDPKLNFIINDSFTGITAENILVFLAKKYNLEFTVVGSIIYVTPYIDPSQFIKPPPKEIKVKYNAGDNTLSVELENDSITAVARKITQVSGKNVIVPNSLLGKKLNGFIAAAPFETAMDKLAYTNELKMVKTNDNYYLFQPLGDSEELYVNSERSTSTRRIYKSAGAVSGGNTGLYINVVNGRKLISVDATNAPIADLVKQASQELNKSYTLYSDIKGTITLRVNNIDYEGFLTLLFKGTDYTFHAENDVYMIGDHKLEGLRTYKVVQLQHRSLDTVLSMIPVDWKKGIEIKEFREQNSLLLSGSAAQIGEVENFIKQLDVIVPVILIEVTIIDINKNRTVATGIAAGVSDSVKTGGTILPGMNFTFSASSVNSLLSSVSKWSSVDLGHVVPNFYVNLSALETTGNVDVRSVPRLSALNGHSASLSIGNSIYYKNTTQNVTPTTVAVSSIYTNTYVESDANMEIAIKPVVSGDEQVTLSIKVNIADFTSIPTDGSPPPKSTSKFETSLRVHNEDTIVLGGIERTETDDNVSGTPILSRIPILKYFFSNKSKSNKKVITVLFIKPTILR
jgi:type IV pilus assembly protein PilQ